MKNQNMIKVRFKDVGARRMSWEAMLPNLEYRTLLREVKVRRAICSRHPDFEKGDGSGRIYAGCRCVGTFDWHAENPPS